MRNRGLFAIGSVLLLLSVTTGIRHARAEGPAAAKKSILFVAAASAKYKEVAPGVSKSLVWGDDTKGAYAAFTKFAPGQDNGMHTHSNDIWLVVLEGAYLYRGEAGEIRVGPGGFLRVPAGTKHWSGGDPKLGALFYEESSGAFDQIPAK